jgi:hypothetical protein
MPGKQDPNEFHDQGHAPGKLMSCATYGLRVTNSNSLRLTRGPSSRINTFYHFFRPEEQPGNTCWRTSEGHPHGTLWWDWTALLSARGHLPAAVAPRALPVNLDQIVEFDGGHITLQGHEESSLLCFDLWNGACAAKSNSHQFPRFPRYVTCCQRGESILGTNCSTMGLLTSLTNFTLKRPPL